MAKDTITLKMQKYNPAMYAKVQQMRERYAVLMNLKGQRKRRFRSKSKTETYIRCAICRIS